MTDPSPLEAIFFAALEHGSAQERAAYLDEACMGDPNLRRRVEKMLAAQAQAGSFLEEPAVNPVVTVDQPISEGPGTVIGPYKLLEQIGEGGFGVVFLAEQTQPVRRKVALKVLKPGMDTRQVIARFEAERQALAIMDHPNIAKVFDGGATPSGRLYFVMELVRGVPITEFCDQNHLTPRLRLELFVQVCHAVQHAHQKGIIHRDLKPSNIMVTVHDTTPVVKVIDFGVVKALGQELTDKTLFTGFAQMIGTPLYMSPEQAGHSGLDIDTRSDIYSLGVLLYELLTGTTPFSKERFQTAAYDEIRRIIREEEPSKPSTKLATAAGLPTLAANRGTEPAKLTRLVRGELDWIVMKALEKDRNRRYETANSFAFDVQRYLADEPVLAGPPSAAYRVRKFLKRNRRPLMVSMALALSLLVGVGAVMAVQAKADRDRATEVANQAVRESWTTASIDAAIRDARERTDEAWTVTDYPDRMQRATDAAGAAVRRADDFAAGGAPTNATLVELASTRQVVGDLTRHTRLITAHAANRQQYADEFNYQRQSGRKSRAAFCDRLGEAVREFGLDPINGSADDLAQAVASNRLRDALLGILLEWHTEVAYLSEIRQKLPQLDGPPADAAVAKDRLGLVIRSTRRLCGGAYARWQDLLDQKDVPGLVAFATSPDGLSFRSTLVRALGRDLVTANQYPASRTFLRAAVDRYPHDVWLHFDLCEVCTQLQPPSYAEALRHMSAASVQQPDSSVFHLRLGIYFAGLGLYEQAAVAYRKSIALFPDASTTHGSLGNTLMILKDLDGAIAANREAVRLDPHQGRAQRQLGTSLTLAGRHAEALQVSLAALQQNPTWTDNPQNNFRYHAACSAMNCAYGRGTNPPPPDERPAYRKQALDLLTADLAACRKLPAASREFVFRFMQHWLENKDLSEVRDPPAVGQLSPAERDAWTRFWAEVRELRDQTAPEIGRPKSDK